MLCGASGSIKLETDFDDGNDDGMIEDGFIKKPGAKEVRLAGIFEARNSTGGAQG